MSERQSGPSPMIMKLAVAGSAVLALAAGGLFYYASISKIKVSDEKLIAIEVGAKACDPMNLTLPSGHHSFEIHNRSDRPVEWEILDGVMVVEERENIIPGMKTVLRAQLLPGEYEITCGLLSNPRGKLTVTPSEHSVTAAATKPDTRAFIGMLSEYKVFLIMQSNAMLKAADALQVAIKAGDLEAARSAYLQTREPYKRTEIMAGRFADLQSQIDPVAAYLEKREDDPAFTGFHRIEYGLWGKSSTEGLESLAIQLSENLGTLKDRLKSAKLTPDVLLRNTASFLNQQAEGQVLSGDNAYSQLDLTDLNAKLDGVEKVVQLLQPLTEKPASAETQSTIAALQTLRDEITKLPLGTYTEIDQQTRQKLADNMKALGLAISKLTATIGLE